MLMLYCILGLIIYNTVAFVLGKINFKEKTRKQLFYIVSIIYNGFIGYIDTYFVLLVYGYFTNMPKGSGYEVPETEAGFNGLLGLTTMIIYIVLLIPINIYMQKRGKINRKMYSIVNIIATLIGITAFWLFLDKNQKLF